MIEREKEMMIEREKEMKKSKSNCCKTLMKPLQRMGDFLNHDHWRLNLNHCHWTQIMVTSATPFFEGENYALFPC